MSSTTIPRPLPPDVNRGPDILIVKWLTVSVALLLVSLRFYVRGVLRKKLGWDDYTILLAVVFAIVESIFSDFQTDSGFGRNIYYLTPLQIQHFELYTTICIMLLIVGTGFVRTSVCLFVLRLVPVTKMSYRRLIWGLLAFCTIPSLANFLAQCFQCVPLSGLWDKSVKARCFDGADMTKIIRVQGCSAFITNLLCALLPMLVVRNVQISQRDKMAIFIVIGLGFFTAATAIARTVLTNFTSKNPTWDLIPVAVWACLEQNIGISVASMPALHQFLKNRKQPYPPRSSQALFNNYYNNDIRHPPRSFTRLSDSDRIYLPKDDSFTESSSGQSSSLPPKKSDIESCHDSRPSLARLSMIPSPLWAERKISSAETVEMSRVSPNPTIVGRKPSSAEKVNMVAPSWTHRKTSSADKVTKSKNKKSLSIVSPLSLGSPPSSPFSAGRVQQVGKFEETGLRHSRVATPEEIMSFGNPAAMGYSCTIEGGTPPKATPKTSPKPSPKAYALINSGGEEEAGCAFRW